MTHHAGQPAEETEPCRKPPMTTGRLALWLGFWLFMSIMFMGAVVSMAGKGAGQ